MAKKRKVFYNKKAVKKALTFIAENNNQLEVPISEIKDGIYRFLKDLKDPEYTSSGYSTAGIFVHVTAERGNRVYVEIWVDPAIGLPILEYAKYEEYKC